MCQSPLGFSASTVGVGPGVWASIPTGSLPSSRAAECVGLGVAEPERMTAAQAGRVALPGDELIPEAELIMDRVAPLPKPPEEVWPWLLQLGKGRAGWYLTRRLERFTPRRSRALRTIDPQYQRVAVGDRVPDYGPDGWFEARIVKPPQALVWWSERGKDLRLSWALVLEPHGQSESLLKVRLRINRRIGKHAPALVGWGASQFDRVTVQIMIAGLNERLTDA